MADRPLARSVRCSCGCQTTAHAPAAALITPLNLIFQGSTDTEGRWNDDLGEQARSVIEAVDWMHP